MSWIIVTVAAAILSTTICAAIFISRIKVTVSFRVVNLSVCQLHIYIKAAFGLVRIKRSLDLKKWLNGLMDEEEAPAEAMKDWQKKLGQKADMSIIKDLKGPLGEAAKQLTVETLVWRSGAGTGNAGETGWIAGIAWTAKGIIEAWLKRYIPMKKPPSIIFEPFYQTQGFETKLFCIISIPTGKAIRTIIRLYRRWKKLNNGRSDINGTSNQGFDDDSDGEFEGNDRREYNRWRSG